MRAVNFPKSWVSNFRIYKSKLFKGIDNMKPTDETPFGVQRVCSELFTRREAAAYLGIREQTLAVWKCTRRYELPFVKIGRLVKYRKIDLDAFIENNRSH